jgi:DNA-binding winged helix-turn-helix (wHTH) protein/tetratricopeptide (TPR) repeat protein
MPSRLGNNSHSSGGAGQFCGKSTKYALAVGPMPTQPGPIQRVVRFGVYQCDFSAGELHKNGIKVKLADQPFRLLTVLLERHGEVVTRQELREQLWPRAEYGEFDDGLNTAVNKLRGVLDDSAENPRFVETIPRRGYRFIAPVQVVSGNGGWSTGVSGRTVFSGEGLGWATDSATSSLPATIVSAPGAAAVARDPSRWRAAWKPLVFFGIFAGVALAGLALWLFSSRPALSFNSHDSVLVADFDNQTGDPRFDQALETAFIVSIEQSRQANVFPRTRVDSVLRMIGRPPATRITRSLGREICQREGIGGLVALGITRTGNEYELTAELIDPRTGETVRSHAERSIGEGHILDALDTLATDIRGDLGESHYQISRAHRPLPEVTTSSLGALKQYADGLQLWHEGRFPDAVTLLRAAIQSDPNFAMAHAALGSAYCSYIMNAQAEGRREYETAIALSSRTTERERMIIQTQYADDLGHVDEADALYRAYLQQYPDDWNMLSNYAHLLRMHGHPLQAIAQYQQVLRVAPDDAGTYIQLATAYKTLDRVPQALQAYSEALRLDPAWLTAGDTAREYGAVLVEDGEDQKAELVFTSMLGKSSEVRESGLRSLAMLDLLHGRYAEAQKRFEQCLVLLENRQPSLSIARVHLWLGLVAEGKGDKAAEKSQLDLAMRDFKAIGPKVVFGAMVGQVYARSGFLEQARKIEAQIAPLADSNSPEQSGYLHLLEGGIALLQKDNDKAIGLLSLSNKENPTPLSSEALAHAFQVAGRTNEAIAEYAGFLSPENEAIFWEPQQRWLRAQYTLATDYAALGERDKAKQTIARLAALLRGADPDLPLWKETSAEYTKLQPPSKM